MTDLRQTLTQIDDSKNEEGQKCRFSSYARWHQDIINPTEKFMAGEQAADAGLTGRKVIVSTYSG